MKFTYRSKEKMDLMLREELETEMLHLKDKYKFLNDDDQLHVEVERLKNLSWKLKISWWISKMGKKLITVSETKSIRQGIVQNKEKLTVQIEKIKFRN